MMAYISTSKVNFQKFAELAAQAAGNASFSEKFEVTVLFDALMKRVVAG